MSNKFMDLQFIIGFYFSLTGIIIIANSLFTTASNFNQLVNFYSGLGITSFGIFMLLAFWLRNKQAIKK